MTLLEKIKINIDYLLGKADPSLYADSYKSQNISSDEWQKRLKLFSEDDYFVWYGFDADGNLAEFEADETYIPEAFFQDASINKKLLDFFRTLPEITKSVVPKTLRYELKQSADNITNENSFWRTGANKGLFIFQELNTEDLGSKQKNNWKNPYELLLLPQNPLKISKLPNEFQNLLEPFYFKDLRFRDCQFVDVSKHLYCEK